MIFIGDTHGNFGYIKYLIEMKKDKNFFHVGDFGLVTEDAMRVDTILNMLDQTLDNRGCKLWVIRGNHDNPKWWNGDFMNKYANIMLIPDYTVVDVEGKRILGVGGAVSVDREPRKIWRHPWWPDEVFSLNEEFLREVRDIDVVVTHTVPDFAFPVGVNDFVRSFAKNDPTLLVDLEEERIELTRMHDILIENNKITDWFYGHFHTDNTEDHGKITFRVLGINETYELMTDTDEWYR